MNLHVNIVVDIIVVVVVFAFVVLVVAAATTTNAVVVDVCMGALLCQRPCCSCPHSPSLVRIVLTI